MCWVEREPAPGVFQKIILDEALTSGGHSRSINCKASAVIRGGVFAYVLLSGPAARLLWTNVLMHILH
jgi:hypothetical protein